VINHRDVSPSSPRTFDWEGETVLVAAESESVFWVSKYVDGAAWKVAKLTRAPDVDAEHPWIVRSTAPGNFEESYSGWRAALKAAASMEVETGDVVE